MKISGNITGAFADGAILFPLLVALVWQTGMDAAILMGSAGAAYVAAGFIFRVPMSVQPLKSVVVAALALGAGAAGNPYKRFVRGAGMSGAFLFCYADKLAAYVPRHLVQGLQLGLGVILMYKGLNWGAGGLDDPFLALMLFTLLSGGMVTVAWRSSLPVMGWVATGGVILAVVFVFGTVPEIPAVSKSDLLRFDIIAALVLPQLALTLTNSVVATQDVAKRYWGDKAERVKPSWLLRSIGLGNIVSAAIGGLPFCHGSGGLTAHVKGGASSWHMNLIIGGFLIALSGISIVFGMALIPVYPKMLMAVLIFATGFFHVQLAASSWRQVPLRFVLIMMGVTALFTQNMLWVLLIGTITEILRRKLLPSILMKEAGHG